MHVWKTGDSFGMAMLNNTVISFMSSLNPFYIFYFGDSDKHENGNNLRLLAEPRVQEGKNDKNIKTKTI